MSEKNYSVDEILAEAGRSGAKRSSRGISEKANRQAIEILQSMQHEQPDDTERDFDALLQELIAHTSAPKKPRERVEVAPVSEAPKRVKVTTIEPPKGEKEIVVAPAPSNVPQSKKKHRPVSEVIDEVMAESTGKDKIESAVADKKEEHSSNEQHLTRTGVIRKANALIADQPEVQVSERPVAQAQRAGHLQPKEKIVGEKEDIQTKAYHQYIRHKEKKKLDTGMIKRVELKETEKTRVMPHTKHVEAPAPQADASTRVAFLVDEETDVEKTIAGTASKRVISNINHTGNIEGQTRLEGFFDDEYEKISEEELEEQLELARREKVDNFNLEKSFKRENAQAVEASSQNSIDDTYAPEKETPIINDVIDYNSENDKRAIYIELEQLFNRFKLRTTLNIVALAAAGLLGILGVGLIGDFGLGTGSERLYIILNTAVLLGMCIINARALVKGLKALFMLKPSGDSLMSFAAIAALAHCVVCIFLGENGAAVSHIYVGAVGFIFLLNSFGKRSMMRRIFKNFRFLMKNKNLYSAACITDEKQAREFVKATEPENTDIRYNAKTEFATRFLANSYADDPADGIAKWLAYPVMIAALIIGVISFFITRDWIAAVSALTAVLLIGVPAGAIWSFNKALENADKTLLKERGTITGFAAVNDAAETTALVVGGESLFPQGTCVLKGMKLFKKMQMDEAILYAASVLEHAHHPFKSVFMEVINDVKDHMPASFDTAYESKLGLSTWIYDRKVLLGNKEMMSAHGIEIPATAKPEEYTHDNLRTMFLAIDGCVYAMFVLEYFADSVTEYELQRLEATGIQILVKTEDSNIDEALLCTLFDLEADSVKVLGMRAAGIYDEKTEIPVYNEAKIIGNGDPVTFMRSLTACSMLHGQFGLLKMLQYIAIGLGVVVVAVLSFMGSIAAIGPVHIAVYGAFWCLVTLIIPKIYKAVPKR